MKYLFKIGLKFLVFILLTLLTQIGGVIYLISDLVVKFFIKSSKNYIKRFLIKLAFFCVLYCTSTFFVVPIVAKSFGRVRLPLSETNSLKPLTFLTCLLNRNYVKPELKNTMFEVAKEMNEQFPGTSINYLDANFPFVDGFPLIPHLSHNDGEKLDLSFCYIDSKSGNSTNQCPSFIGYGVCEDPFPNEFNTTLFCEKRGYWQYSLLTKIVSQSNKINFKLDLDKTSELIKMINSKPSIGKIFIEPHLVKRLHLNLNKIKFHGCRAVRHDDHIHIQLN